MGFIEERNIRDTLKKVYDLYSVVKDLVFTTYDFDPTFFEEHIISYLMGNDKKITTIGELNAANKWIAEHNIAVYYDARELKSGSCSITLPVYPKLIHGGVFHPKVVIIYGEIGHRHSTHLIVSSCNLTVSGFGRNTEVFSCIEVRSQIVADSLLRFLNKLCEGEDWIDSKKRHGELKAYLKNNRNFNSTKNVEFFWNYGGSKDTFERKLSLLPSGNVNIVSPYFDKNGPGALLDSMKGKRDVCIFPAVDGKNYNITEKDYLELKRDGVRFAELPNTGIKAKKGKQINKKENARFVHAKIISKGKYICVGSYNFTSAALKGKNAEAALIFRWSEEPKIKKESIIQSRFLPYGELVKNGDETSDNLDNVFVSVTVDWRSNIVVVYAELPDIDKEYLLSIKDFCQVVINGTYELELDDAFVRTIIKHKQFSVHRGNTVCFEGLINELNWVGIRPEICCESLDEAMDEWIIDNSKKEKEHVYDMREFISEDDVTEKFGEINSDAVIPKINLFDNYFLVSKAMESMLGKIDDSCAVLKHKPLTSHKAKSYREWEKEEKKANDELYGILQSKPGSMTRILEFVEKEEKNKEHDPVYLWLICRYLKAALDKMPRKLEKTPVFEIKNREFTNKLKSVLYEYELIIKRDVSEEYYQWIIKEIFKDRVKNV